MRSQYESIKPNALPTPPQKKKGKILIKYMNIPQIISNASSPNHSTFMKAETTIKARKFNRNSDELMWKSSWSKLRGYQKS